MYLCQFWGNAYSMIAMDTSKWMLNYIDTLTLKVMELYVNFSSNFFGEPLSNFNIDLGVISTFETLVVGQGVVCSRM